MHTRRNAHSPEGNDESHLCTFPTPNRVVPTQLRHWSEGCQGILEGQPAATTAYKREDLHIQCCLILNCSKIFFILSQSVVNEGVTGTWWE